MDSQLNIIGDASKARLIAVFIDHVVAFGLTMVGIAFVPESLPVLKAVSVFGIYLAYFVVLETLWSRTVGKYFQGLVVRRLDGSRCDLKSALIRSLARLVEVNPLLVGGVPAGIVIIASLRKQRIGDMLAGTLVVPTYLVWEGKQSLDPDCEIADEDAY
jgi:uncharacterized RDD family membrane protein YckC